MRDFAIESIEDNSLVIVDSRIYRGRIAWLFNDKHYLETGQFVQLLQEGQKIGDENLVPHTVYFIECAKDDCGWGTITGGELNDTSEAMIAQFNQIAGPVASFNGGGGYDEETDKPHFNVYKTQVNLHPASLNFADQTHSWFYYPVRYTPKENSWDHLQLNSFNSKFWHSFGFIVLYLSIIIALMAPFLLFYELEKQD